MNRCRFLCLPAITGTIVLGLVVVRAEEPAAGRAAAAGEAGVQAAGRLWGAALGAVKRAALQQPADGQPAEPAGDPQAAARQQRQQQIDQQAKQMEQFFQPVLQAELELVHRTCGSLAADARRQVVAAGNEAVKATARQFAARQFGERGNSRFDGRKTISEAVAAAAKQHAKPEERAAYERELAARLARRDRAARTRIVAKLDQELQLTAAQRAVIEADLEKRWDAAWIRELDDPGGHVINNHRPAPDFADACIARHLDERQRADWKQWCQQAGWSRVGQHIGFNLDGQSLQPDPWWAP